MLLRKRAVALWYEADGSGKRQTHDGAIRIQLALAMFKSAKRPFSVWEGRRKCCVYKSHPALACTSKI